MDITIRHLSGSKAGQEQRFGQNRITFGRNPTNDVAFDPQEDSIVSGQHVELTPRHDGWLLRDLGSSNGTFVNDERVTEHVLRPQEVVQLGKNGPRLQFNFELPAGVQAPAGSQSNAPVEGRTVMMMINEGVPASMSPAPAGFPATAHSAPAYTASAPVKKKGGILKALLLVILLIGFLMVAGLAAVIYVRSGSKADKTATKTTSTQPASTAASTTAPVVATTATSAASGVAPGTTAAQTSTAALTTASPQTNTGIVAPGTSGKPLTMTDLEQQLARSQQLIDGLQKQLQETNDRLQKTIQEKDAAIQRAVRDRNAALKRARDAEARAQSQSSMRILERPKPVQVTGMLPPSMLATLAMQAEDLDASLDGLMKDKIIKKRIAYVAEQAEIPLPGMPTALPASLGRLVIQSLASTGKYVSVRKTGDASISVVVTNYKSDVRTPVKTDKVGRGVGSVSRIFGGPNVPTPAGVETVSMDADMTARVKLLDPANSELGEVFAEAASKDRKTSLDLGSLDINQIENTDTALGDVTRKVAADAVEYLLGELENIEWQGLITRSDIKTNMITVDCGSRCQIEVGDVFSINDGSERIGAVIVRKITADTAVAEMTSGEGSMKGKTVRFEGRSDESPATRKSRETRTLKTRAAGAGHAGPGFTFPEAKKLKAGVSLNLMYTVGSWAKVSDGTTSFWIPMENAQITS